MLINISKENIEGAARGECPITTQLKVIFPNAEFYVLPREIVFITEDNNEISVELPNEAVRFIKGFDKGLMVYPITIELPIEELYEDYIRLSAHN